MNIFIFLGSSFIIIFGLGYFLEKIKIPWVFAALFFGLGLSLHPSLQIEVISHSEIFIFLAKLGMYFLLFLIGYELDIAKIIKMGKFIILSTFFIIFSEAIFGSLLIHFVFGYTWLISVIVALSFATIGEAVLIPILDEFKLTKTRLGQTILGIGTFDDTIEIFLVLLVIILLPFLQHDGAVDWNNILDKLIHIVIGLSVLGLLCFVFRKVRNKTHVFNFMKIDEVFFLVIAVFFLFLGLAQLSGNNLDVLGAILAGIALGNFLPTRRKLIIETQIKAVAFGFFGPIFFLWVGMDTDLKYLLSSPLLVLLVIIVANASKISTSYIIGRKKLGTHQSIIMGIALGVRFSTSIVIIKFLFENKVIENHLYSVLIGSTIAFKFIIPFTLAYFIKKWKMVIT